MALLTLAEAKAQLDIDTLSDDVQLQLYIEALTPVIEGYIGPVEARTVTETVQGAGITLALLHAPVLSVASLTPVLSGGTAVDVNLLHVDGPSGVLSYTTGAAFQGGPWTATYTAGRAAIPATVKLASLLLLQHLWSTRYGAARGVSRTTDYDVTEPMPGFGYAVPNRVIELLRPLMQPPGIA
ncbi:head-tail connector protein [Streptomyces sp. NPDC046237]|uniref:head-tail connector protein n=1 Tax=Streptomyces sp. NPDC046237 TaxID=3154914 RepID=UPI00340A51A7